MVTMRTADTSVARMEQGWGAGFSRPAVFALVCALLYAITLRLSNELCEPINRMTAKLTELLLITCGTVPQLDGSTLSLNGFRVQVVTECSGLYLAVLFVAFLACWPSSPRAKVLGMLAGLPFLCAANVVRIAAVTAAGAIRPDLFPYLHVYLAQVMMVLLVCLCSFAWLHWSSGSLQHPALFSFSLRLLSAASLLFLCWLPLHHSYVCFLDHLVIRIFSLVEFVLFIPEAPAIYHHTFSLVVFASLICASTGASPRRRAFALAVGLPMLATVHLFFRVTHVLLTAWHLQSVLPVHLTLHVINQYLLPVFLWIWLVGGVGEPAGDAR